MCGDIDAVAFDPCTGREYEVSRFNVVNQNADALQAFQGCQENLLALPIGKHLELGRLVLSVVDCDHGQTRR